VRIASQINALQADLLSVISETARRDECGPFTVAEYVSNRTGVTKSEANRLVRLARALPSLPCLAGSMHDGRVSVSVAAQAVKVATPSNEQALCEVLDGATPSQVGRIVSEFRRRLPAPPEAEERSSLVVHHDDDGTVVGRFEMPADQGIQLEKALDAARDELVEGGDPNPSGGDVLFELALHYLDTRHTHIDTRNDRYVTMIHVDIDGLTAMLDNGTPLDPITAETLLCDGDHELLIKHEGNPLYLGHTERYANREQRRAMRGREGGCAVCGRKNRYLHAHHVNAWPFGETNIDQLVFLCRRHHRAVHRGQIIIRLRGPSRFEFSARDGTPLANGPPANADAPLPQVEPNAAAPAWGGERMTQWALQTILEHLLPDHAPAA
jgi:hypothetical protein